METFGQLEKKFSYFKTVCYTYNKNLINYISSTYQKYHYFSIRFLFRIRLVRSNFVIEETVKSKP